MQRRTRTTPNPSGTAPGGLLGLRRAGTVLVLVALVAWAGAEVWLRLPADDEVGVHFGPMWLVVVAVLTGVCGVAFVTVAAVAGHRDRTRAAAHPRE